MLERIEYDTRGRGKVYFARVPKDFVGGSNRTDEVHRLFHAGAANRESCSLNEKIDIGVSVDRSLCRTVLRSKAHKACLRFVRFHDIIFAGIRFLLQNVTSSSSLLTLK